MLTKIQHGGREGFEVRTHIVLIEKRVPIAEPVSEPSGRVMWTIAGVAVAWIVFSACAIYGFWRMNEHWLKAAWRVCFA